MVKSSDNCSTCIWDLKKACSTYIACKTCPHSGDGGNYCKCSTIFDGEECPYYVHCSDKYSKPHIHCNYCENGGKFVENSYRLEICGEQIQIEFCPKCGRKLQVD